MKPYLTTAILLLTAGCLAAAEPPVFQLRSVADAATPTTAVYSLPRGDGTTETLHLEAAILLDQSALKSATAKKDQRGQSSIFIVLTETGAKRFAAITEQHVGKRLGIVIAGKLLFAPVVRQPILGGSLEMSGNLTEQEAADLVARLNGSI